MDIGTYESDGRAKYAKFSAVVASILTAAITEESGLRLQVVVHRAKNVKSLMKKLAQRDKSSTNTLESDIKDLAGCRVVFYTNTDVSNFMSSQIIFANFEIIETKFHQPKRQVEDAAELYTSNHFIVRLREDRTALPEYAEFEGMQCEVQIQTILNHSWAEMAHDTIYKSPDLNGFGERALDDVNRRLSRVMRQHLVPAGYQFDKIANDFERIVKGKKLFDEGALEAIINSPDNNKRAEALDAFREHVLPYYDDVRREFPLIMSRLTEAVGIARKTKAVPIETPVGTLPAMTSADIVDAVAKILGTYRYADVDLTFDTLCDLYANAINDDERKPILELGEVLARHEMRAWEKAGPAVQEKITECIARLEKGYRLSVQPLLTCMLGEVLKPTIDGTTSESNAVTIHRNAVVASDRLRAVRESAMTLLKDQFAESESEKTLWAILNALEESTRTPSTSNYSNNLALMVAESAADLLAFQTEKLGTFSFEMLQIVEDRALGLFRTYSKLPETMSSDSRLFEAAQEVVTSALVLRDAAKANTDFVTYKILVGFRSVFPPAWEDPNFSLPDARAYREAALEQLLESVNSETAEYWFEMITRCSETQSNDAGTFPVFAQFLERVGQKKPAIVLGYVDQMRPDLTDFLPPILTGLVKSGAPTVSVLLDKWIDTGEHLRRIAVYLRRADPFDDVLLRRVLEASIDIHDSAAVKEVMVTAEWQSRDVAVDLVNTVFFPAFRFLASRDDMSWINMGWHVSWLNSPILKALDECQASEILDSLIRYPQIEDNCEHVVAAIAERWPTLAVDFFGWRQEFPEDQWPERYQEFPYSLYELREPLQAAGIYLIEAVREWFNQDERDFHLRGAQLLASVFNDIDADLKSCLHAYIQGGDPHDIRFVLDVLYAFKGKPAVFELVKEIVARVDLDGTSVEWAISVLESSDGWSGEFGREEIYAERKEIVTHWLNDSRESVLNFAEKFISIADLNMAHERQRARASIASQRLDYNEEIGNLEGD